MHGRASPCRGESTSSMTLIDPIIQKSAATLAPAATSSPGAVAGQAAAVVPPSSRTIWGLDPVQLHTRYWASLGVQVVRQGEPSEIVKHAELFLLAEPGTMTLFRL